MDQEPQQLAADDSEVSGLGPRLSPRARLRSIWDDTAGTDDTDDVEDLGDAEEHTLEPAEAARWYTGS